MIQTYTSTTFLHVRTYITYSKYNIHRITHQNFSYAITSKRTKFRNSHNNPKSHNNNIHISVHPPQFNTISPQTYPTIHYSNQSTCNRSHLATLILILEFTRNRIALTSSHANPQPPKSSSRPNSKVLK